MLFEDDSGYGVKVERRLDASRESVFRAWTEPEMIRRWWAPEGFTSPSADVDLRVGGAFAIGMTNPEGVEVLATGTYAEVSPPDRLVFSWSWRNSPLPETQVAITLTEEDGRTLFTLVHTGFPEEDPSKMHQMGWEGCADRIVELAEALG